MLIPSLRSFYFDGHTRNPCRWLIPTSSPVADPLCLYSLQIPHTGPPLTAAPLPSPTSLILNIINPSTTEERRLIDDLRRKLFPGCIIHIPVKYWTRTSEPSAHDSGSVATGNRGGLFRGVMDDYLRRERAIKTVIFASLKLR